MTKFPSDKSQLHADVDAQQRGVAGDDCQDAGSSRNIQQRVHRRKVS